MLWGCVLAAAIGLGLASLRDPLNRYAAEPAAAQFVGSTTCNSCHTAESARWSKSQHRAAMATATSENVVGDFRNAAVTYAGTTSRFFKRDDKFYVHTDGRDGVMGDFEIKYTFGVYPLQQYLVEFTDGRIQALSIAWDARPRKDGGQRWFHLYPNERITHDDELHWTRPAQNWNYMCADCHSTAVRKNYDPAADRFATRSAEISVGCEACHGPASRHVDWAKRRQAGLFTQTDSTRGFTTRLDERRGVTWTVNSSTGNAARSRPRKTQREIETCAQCHARRTQLDEGYEAGKPFLDYYRPALLERPLYHPDGQQRDEVYTWGSFLQSRMHAKGVTCGDCHDPHSGKLRAAGNNVCASCHQATKYNAPAHLRHQQGSTGASCTACHMPATNYMVIDPRHDHSLRVPRPDLSVKLGTPNACTSCHTARSAGWAAAQVTEWYGPVPQPDRRARAAEALAASDRGTLANQALLRAVALDTAQPRITRATALTELNAAADAPSTLRALREGLVDGNAVMRLGALRSVAQLPPEWRVLATRLLSDTVRAVRVEAVALLARAPVDQFSFEQRAAFERAAGEFTAAQRYNADRPDGHANLGTFYAEQGKTAQAESELNAALRLDPFFIPAYINLADVYRLQGRDAEGERILRLGLSRVPNSAALQHSLGLALVRLKRNGDALAALARASELAPQDARFAYVYAVALHSAGKVNSAIAKLETTLNNHPEDNDILAALVSFYQGRGDGAKAKRYSDQLRMLNARVRRP
jgi:predicted CXXCH cytochrome family protein